MNRELEALLFLSHLPHVGAMKMRLLIAHFGSAAAALQAKAEDLTLLPGFGPRILHTWAEKEKYSHWEQTLHLAQRLGIHIIPYTSSEYPKRLLEIVDHPLILYMKGTFLPRDQRCIAIVGTRQSSIYGKEMAERLGYELAQAGFTIVSGLARGIDTAAHEGACRSGRTFAVLGSGLGHIYPKENEKLAHEIQTKGALLSEFPISTPPDRQLFPQRNRIVSGMTLGTILVEAPAQSGAMITVERALSQGRKVFALPGRVDQENFQGNHRLIKFQQGQLIENSQDVIMHYDDLLAPLSFRPIAHTKPALEPEEEELMRMLPQEELSIEDVAMKSRLPIAKVSVLLMSLVLKKCIKEYPGKIYKKC